jgi:hypothetical protein
MAPYWLLFTVFAIGAGFASERRSLAPHRSALPLGFFVVVIMALMIGLRYHVGADWLVYERMFSVAGYADLGRVLALGDPGYQFLNWGVRQLGGSLWQVNLVCALIFCWGLLRLARAQPRPWLTVVVAVPYLVTVVAMGYTRQAVAIGILMAGLAAIHRGASTLRFAAYVAFAALFHKTAVVALPLVIFASERNLLINVILGLALCVLFYNIFLERSVTGLMRNYIDARYSSQGAAIRVALNFIPAVLYLLRPSAFGFEPGERKVYRHFAYAALLFPVVLAMSPSSTAVDRIALYILPLQLVVLGRVPIAYRMPGFGTVLVVIYSALILFTWLVFATHAEYWLPYQIYPLL